MKDQVCNSNAAPCLNKAPRPLKLSGQVGFDALPEQLVFKSLSSGFCFNILCVGETGIGKSTLMESLFSVSFDTPPSCGTSEKVHLRQHSCELKEGNVQLHLKVIETVGFGDQIDKRESYKAIADFIDAQFQTCLDEELHIQRTGQPLDAPLLNDSCIHVCLYFLEPTGHSIKALDLVTMKCLDSRVNLIPIIAKADTLSKSELVRMKQRVSADLSSVKLYKWPTDDENVAELNRQMNELMPFAVVGSKEFVKIGNKSVRGRQYPWGVVQVENENHCDFVKLREMLIRTNMLDLIESTHLVHYELYRRKRLTELGIPDVIDGSSSLSLYETRRLEIRAEMEKKDSELRQTFIEKVKQKELDLKEIEKEIHEELTASKQWFRENKEKLDERLNALTNEIAMFEAKKQSKNKDKKHLRIKS